MREIFPQIIIMATGGLLILVGLGMVLYEFLLFLEHEPAASFASRSLDLNVLEGSMKLTTTMPGFVIIAFGIFLEIIGYLGTKPWTQKKERTNR